jgi:trimethylamine-N-oxide reductase (cytochrome c)
MVPRSSATRSVLNASHWGAFCARVESGRVVETVPFLDRMPAPAAEMIRAIPAWLYSENRVKYPMVRAGYLKKGAASDRSERGRGDFVRVEWDQALSLVARELERVRDEYGAQSIYDGSYGWASVGMLHDAPALLKRMLALHGPVTSYTGDYSTGAAQVILPHVTGEIDTRGRQTSWSSILNHSSLIVLWGNELITNNVIGYSPPDHCVLGPLDELRARRGRIAVVTIDPVRTDTAEHLGSEWIPVRPNTDVALMLAIAYALYDEGLYRREFIDNYTVGFERFLGYLLGADDGQAKTPEWAAPITGVEPEAIRGLARRMARSRTILMAGYALQRQDHGEQGYWMLVTLAAMLGQIGLPGGGFGLSFGYDHGGAVNAPRLRGIIRQRIPSAGVRIPVARVADLLQNPGKTINFNGREITYPDIKLVYWSGGNPLQHHQDKNRLIAAWRRPETVVVNEIFWTATARLADIVLPVSTALERNDVEQIVAHPARYVIAMKQAIEPLHEARSDFDICAELAARLGFSDRFTEGRTELDWVRYFYDAARSEAVARKLAMPEFDAFWNREQYVQFPPAEAAEYVSYADFRRDPDRCPLKTPSGKIEIYSKTIEGFGYRDCPAHPAWIEPQEWLGSAHTQRYPLHLLSPHPKFRIHSQLGATAIRSAYEVAGREPIWLNPIDAAARGVADGDVVRVFNGRGQALAGAVVTDRIRPGVVLICEGGWYDPEHPGEINTLDKHGDVNVLTLDKGSSSLAQACAAHTALVDVEKYRGDASSRTDFTAP